MMTNNIYGDVSSMTDIRTINRKIRGEMRQVRNQAELTELKKRSDYLLHADAVAVLARALRTQERTPARRRQGRGPTHDAHRELDCHRRGLDVDYHAWGSQ
jgi:hypothetical protein